MWRRIMDVVSIPAFEEYYVPLYSSIDIYEL
jgi:hypothetical protein